MFLQQVRDESPSGDLIGMNFEEVTEAVRSHMCYCVGQCLNTWITTDFNVYKLGAF